MYFEFLIPKRPVSGQTRNRANLQKWKSYVNAEAAKLWTDAPISRADLRLSLVYLCDPQDPVDVDNIIKPIQDALVGLVYSDDVQISDVESHRRPFVGAFDVTRFPSMLLTGLLSSRECVYVRVWEAGKLEDYL